MAWSSTASGTPSTVRVVMAPTADRLGTGPAAAMPSCSSRRLRTLGRLMTVSLVVAETRASSAWRMLMADALPSWGTPRARENVGGVAPRSLGITG
jgi:hypothetical protein